MTMQIKFSANSKGKPPFFAPLTEENRCKVADCELWFAAGPLAGYKLQGFTIWRRTVATDKLPVGNLMVLPPDFQNKTAAGTQTVSLLREVGDETYSHQWLRKGKLKDAILEAYRTWANK